MSSTLAHPSDDEAALRVPPQLPADLERRLLRARRARSRRQQLVALAFLAPNLVFFCAFLLWPVGKVALQSFQEGGVIGPAQWVGLQNWETALSDDGFLTAIKNTAVLTAMFIPVTFACAISLALLLRALRRGGAVFRAAVYFPALAPFVVAALAWLFVINPDFGLFNVLLKGLGGEPLNFRGDSKLAMPMIVAVEAWRSIGFWALFLLAALLAVPRELYQAAEIDGAGAVRRFVHVTLPGIRPQLFVAILLSTLSIMQTFDSVFILTDGGPNGSTETAVTYIYKSLFERGQVGYAAVLSLVLVMIIILMTLLAGRVVGRNPSAR